MWDLSLGCGREKRETMVVDDVQDCFVDGDNMPFPIRWDASFISVERCVAALRKTHKTTLHFCLKATSSWAKQALFFVKFHSRFASRNV